MFLRSCIIRAIHQIFKRIWKQNTNILKPDPKASSVVKFSGGKYD
jgi:hypothetical protein